LPDEDQALKGEGGQKTLTLNATIIIFIYEWEVVKYLLKIGGELPGVL